MRRSTYALGASALAGLASAQYGNYCDDLGRCYTSFTSFNGIVYGIAIPEVDAAPFDMIVQVTVPVEQGWAAVAYGPGMTNRPLTVHWPNGESTLSSARTAFSYSYPSVYEDATMVELEGSYVNDTHWVSTSFCRGCSEWPNLTAEPKMLDPNGEQTFGYAFSANPVNDPTDPGTTFSIHDGADNFRIDLSTAKIANFGDFVPEIPGEPEPTPTDTPTPTETPEVPIPTGPVPVPTNCGVESRFPLEVAEGWSFVKLAGNLQNPRSIKIDSLGSMLLVEVGKGLTVHTFGEDGCIAGSKLLIDMPNLTHSVELSVDGNKLFTSTIDTVYSYDYDAATQSVSNEAIVVSNMYPSSHSTRTLLIPPATPNLLIVSLGSDGNLDETTDIKETGRAIVKVFDMDTVPEGGHDYTSGTHYLGYGLRNEVGLAVDNNNMIWGVENSADEFMRTIDGVEHPITENNPAEELNYLGDPSVSNEDWYGYPTCFTVWGGSDFPDGNPETGSIFIPAPSEEFSDATCQERTVAPRLSFQAHSAPLDAKFDGANANLYVSFHGSWNREAPTGYKVVSVPFTNGSNGYEPVAAPDSTDGYVDLLWDPQEDCNSSKCFRPVGLHFDKEETRLFISSDNSQEGELYILVKA